MILQLLVTNIRKPIEVGNDKMSMLVTVGVEDCGQGGNWLMHEFYEAKEFPIMES